MTVPAREEAAEAEDWIGADSPEAAEGWIEGLFDVSEGRVQDAPRGDIASSVKHICGSSSSGDARVMVSWQSWIDLVSVAGAVVSVASLIFSILTLRAALDAKEVSRRALSAARGRNAADIFEELSNRAKSLLDYVQSNHASHASLRATDLFTLLPSALSRWSAMIGDEEAIKDLNLLSQSVGLISRSLDRDGVPEEGPDRERLIKRCHQIVEKLSSTAGKMQSASEDRIDEQFR